MRNNFDQSSTGTNITCSCYYDTPIAQMNFDENFKIIQHESYTKNTKAYYVDYGNVEDHESITFSLKGSTADIIKYANENLSEKIVAVSGKELEELKEQILDSLSETPSLLTYQDQNKHDLKNTGLEIIPSKKIEWIAIRGYSQGDYAEVAYCPDDLEKAWGNKPEEESLKETFQHLFYDAPIYASFDINGTEYNYHDMPDYNEYEWKREEFLNYVVKESGVEKEKLSALLPENPDYPK